MFPITYPTILLIQREFFFGSLPQIFTFNRNQRTAQVTITKNRDNSLVGPMSNDPTLSLLFTFILYSRSQLYQPLCSCKRSLLVYVGEGLEQLHKARSKAEASQPYQVKERRYLNGRMIASNPPKSDMHVGTLV